MIKERARIVFLDGKVDEGSAMNVIIKLLALEQEDDTREIKLYINSNGGNITDGLAIYDTMQYIKSPVSTVCCGMAASMGAFLLSCGEKGKRFALPHSRILIHQPLITYDQAARETETHLQKMAASIRSMRDELEGIMAKNTGKPIETLHADCERDNWMSAEEALAYGLIDGIIDKV